MARLRILLAVLATLLTLCMSYRGARADVVPPAPELPHTLNLDEALRVFRARGLDLLIAEAAVRTAEGGVTMAGAVQNPVLTTSVGNSLTWANTYASGKDCSAYGALCYPWGFTFGITDSAALEDWLSGKRDLRLKAARNALAAAKMSRVDAARTIGFQVKATYLQMAQAQLAYRFAKEVDATEATTLKKFQERYRSGAINEGDLQRIEVQKLEADQAVDTAQSTLRQARAALAFLLGARGDVADYEVDAKVLDYSELAALRSATAIGLLRTAFDHRPDLVSAAYLRASAEAQLELVRRQKFPDLTVGMNYTWGGFNGWSVDNSIMAPFLTFSISGPLPIFYQLQGEQRQAEAQRDTNSLQHAKATAQVANDVATGLAVLDASRGLVQRMEGPRREGGGLLESAKGAFDIVAAQYDKGAATLTDYLDALRTYIATRNEYFGDLANYWTGLSTRGRGGKGSTMKARSCVLLLAAALILARPRSAFAAGPNEAGVDGDGAVDDASDDSAAPTGDGAATADDGASNDDGSNGTPSRELQLRCDGALCDTTTGGTTCSIAEGLGKARGALPFSVVAVLAAMALVPLRRRAHRAKERAR
jgi:cobalt-zinc-cadmium efflux system outer membrane protein